MSVSSNRGRKVRSKKLEIRISRYLSGVHKYKISMLPEEFQDKLPCEERFREGINVEGTIQKVEKELKVSMKVQAEMITVCDRCLKQVRKNIQGVYERVFIYGDIKYEDVSEKKRIEFTLEEEVKLHLENDIRETLLLTIPLRMLCEGEDCKTPSYDVDEKPALSKWKLAWSNVAVKRSTKNGIKGE